MPDMPAITPAQIVAFATAILGALVVLFKLDLTDAQTGAIIGLIGTLAPIGLFIADAIIRHGRSKIAAAAIQSGRSLSRD